MFDDFDSQVQIDEFPEHYALSFETLSLSELEDIHGWFEEVERLEEEVGE